MFPHSVIQYVREVHHPERRQRGVIVRMRALNGVGAAEKTVYPTAKVGFIKNRRKVGPK